MNKGWNKEIKRTWDHIKVELQSCMKKPKE